MSDYIVIYRNRSGDNDPILIRADSVKSALLSLLKYVGENFSETMLKGFNALTEPAELAEYICSVKDIEICFVADITETALLNKSKYYSIPEINADAQ